MTDKDTHGPAFPPSFMVGSGQPPGLTARAYAAIHLKVPGSGLEWLDEMIKQSLLQDAHPLHRVNLIPSDMAGMMPGEVRYRKI